MSLWNVVVSFLLFLPALASPHSNGATNRHSSSRRVQVTEEVAVGANGNGAIAKKKFKVLFVNAGSSFFEPVAQGFLKTCQMLNMDFDYFGELHEGDLNATILQAGPGSRYLGFDRRCKEKINVIQEALANDSGIDGIVLKVPCNESIGIQLAQEAHDANIPLVFFDGDSPRSKRTAYVGTDNEFLGRTMARLLRQLRPEGGTFTMLGKKEGRYQGFFNEITKENNNDQKAHWYEIGQEFEDVKQKGGSYEGMSRWSYEMFNKVTLKPSAMVAMYQSPMKDENWTLFQDEYNRDRNITMIGVDGADYQIDFLNDLYVDGLVGQLPYQIGKKAAEVLLDIMEGKARDPNFQPEQTIHTTNVVAYNLIPVELPELELEQNLLGNLRYIGFVCFGIVATACVGCIGWVIVYRNTPVVKMTQPFFLVMVAVGVLIMASSLIPLSYDDDGSILADEDSDNMITATNVPATAPSASPTSNPTVTGGIVEEGEPVGEQNDVSSKDVAICMSIPWLAFCGFSIIFSALFSKTWRIKQLLNVNNGAQRIQVSTTDVLAPFSILMVCNLTVLICWTVIDPLTYTRQFKSGTDFWNREIESYGACRSDNAVAFLVPLILSNASVLAIACWQAFVTRDIPSYFSESRSIGLSLASILQTFLTGVPVVAVVRDMPIAFYLVLTFVISALSVALLIFIFGFKINTQRKFATLTEREQRKMISTSIRQHIAGSSDLSSMHLNVSPQNPSLSSGYKSGELPIVKEAEEVGSDVPVLPPMQPSSLRDHALSSSSKTDPEKALQTAKF